MSCRLCSVFSSTLGGRTTVNALGDGFYIVSFLTRFIYLLVIKSGFSLWFRIGTGHRHVVTSNIDEYFQLLKVMNVRVHKM